MREKALLNVEAEEMELSDRVNEMKQTVHVLETEKNDSIKRLLSKIHRADSDKAESIEEMNNSIKENQKKRKSNDDVRNKGWLIIISKEVYCRKFEIQFIFFNKIIMKIPFERVSTNNLQFYYKLNYIISLVRTLIPTSKEIIFK
jgi:hypothetical protein